MYIRFQSFDHINDPLITHSEIPDRLQEYLLPNAARSFHHSRDFEYLEQRYFNDSCVMCWLDIFANASCVAFPVAENDMMTIVYMIDGSPPCFLHGFGRRNIIQGFGYLFYVPKKLLHEVHFQAGHYRVVYCAFAASYLANLAEAYSGISELLRSFKEGSQAGLIEKAAPIEWSALYQMWLVQQCGEGLVYCQEHLKARCVDLILDYLFHANLPRPEKRIFNSGVVARTEQAFVVKKIIDEHEDGKLEIAEMAKMVAMNQQQLKKIFKQTIKITIGQYQLESRINRAKQLLQHTDWPILDIALRVGYQDDASLSRVFRSKLQMRPHEYRLKSRNF